MIYDDAQWHYAGNFPEHLAKSAGATHIGMYLAWCLLNELAGECHTGLFEARLESLKNRAQTPGQWFIENCEEVFTADDLNPLGNQFSAEYYASEQAPYLIVYEQCLGLELQFLYEVADSWENYDQLAPLLDADFKRWQAANPQ